MLNTKHSFFYDNIEAFPVLKPIFNELTKCETMILNMDDKYKAIFYKWQISAEAAKQEILKLCQHSEPEAYMFWYRLEEDIVNTNVFPERSKNDSNTKSDNFYDLPTFSDMVGSRVLEIELTQNGEDISVFDISYESGDVSGIYTQTDYKLFFEYYTNPESTFRKAYETFREETTEFLIELSAMYSKINQLQMDFLIIASHSFESILRELLLNKPLSITGRLLYDLNGYNAHIPYYHFDKEKFYEISYQEPGYISMDKVNTCGFAEFCAEFLNRSSEQDRNYMIREIKMLHFINSNKTETESSTEHE